MGRQREGSFATKVSALLIERGCEVIPMTGVITPGVADRLVLLPGGKHVWLELKTLRQPPKQDRCTIKFQPAQRPWLRRRIRNKECALVLVGVPNVAGGKICDECFFVPEDALMRQGSNSLPLKPIPQRMSIDNAVGTILEGAQRAAAFSQKLLSRIKRHEGFRGRPYTDTTGHTTIGYGRNLDDNPLTESEAEVLLVNDLQRTHEQLLRRLPIYATLNEIRRDVLLELGFQLGVSGLLRFSRMLRALEYQRWEEAAWELMDSKYAKQVPERASRLAFLLRGKDVEIS